MVQVLRSSRKQDHRLRHYPWYRKTSRPYLRILQHQPSERSRIRFRWARRLFLCSVVHRQYFQRSRRRIPQRYHKQGQHLHTHQPRRNRDIHQKVRRKNHSAQGSYILCNRAFHLPHLQVHNQRNGHNTYRFLHDARRIRHWRHLPQHTQHRRTRRTPRKDSHTSHRWRSCSPSQERRQPQSGYRKR